MKKLYIQSLSIILSFSLSFISTVSFGQLNTLDVPTSLCANESFTLSYDATAMAGSFNAGNVFTAEISASDGTFPGQDIGSVTSTSASGTIDVTIPITTFSPSYRIRTKASDSPVIGTATAPISINCTTRDYYWVGGTGNWSELSHWEYTVTGVPPFTPAVVLPQPNDNVNFDANSFPTGGTLNFDQFVDINDFYWEPGSGANNPDIVANGNTLKLRGELILDAGVVTQFDDIEFNSTKHFIEINYGDNILADNFPGRVRFFGGGMWDLNSEMTTEGLELYNTSTFSTNDYNLDLLNGSLWDDGSICTFNSGSSDINLGSISITQMIINDNATWHFHDGWIISSNNPLNIVIIESGNYFIDNTNGFNELFMMPGTTLSLRDVYPLNITSNFEAIGTRDKLITIKSQNSGVQATLNITPGSSFTADFIAIEDNIVTGDTDYLPTNWVNNGNNTGWDFSALNQLTGLNYYWVGGSGNWSDYSAHWAKLQGGGGFRASPPGSVDNIFFTPESFPSGGTITVDSDVSINTMEWQTGSGATSPRLRGNGTTITMSGDLTLDAGVKRSVNFNFKTLSGETQNLDFGNNLYESGSINLTGEGTWDLQSNLEINELSLNGGIFNTKDHQIDVYRIYINDNTGISNWGTSTVNIYELRNQTGLTPIFNASASIFSFGTDSKSYTYINGPVALGETHITGESYINNDNTFKSLFIESGSIVTIEQSSTQFIDIGGNFTALGLRDQPITIKSNSSGSLASFSQTSGTNNSSFLIIEDVNTIGALVFSADYSTYNGVARQSPLIFNGWAFGNLWDVPLNFYWVGNSGNWSDYANHWATSADGSNMHIFAPGDGDNVFFSPNSFTIVGQSVTLDNPVTINNMTWEANSGLNSPTITAIYDNNADIFNSLTILGNLEIDNGVQRSINNLIFDSSNTNNIDFADNIGTFDYPDRITFRGGGTWNLQSPLSTYDLIIEDATFNSNNFDLTINNTIIINTPTSNLQLGTSNIYLEGQLADYSGGGGIINAAACNIYINERGGSLGGNLVLNNVQALDKSNLFIQNSLSISNLILDPGSELKIAAGETLTTNSLSAIGTSGKPITIKSSVNGSQGFIVQSSGVVNGTNILISDNNASGGAAFNLASSLIIGSPPNVDGWVSSAAPTYQYNWVGGTGNWSDISHWTFSTDGGVTFNPAVSVPGMLDDVFFNTSSFTEPGQRVEIDQNSYCRNMVWTTSLAQAPTLSGSFDIQLTVFGSFILANGVKRNIQELTFESYTAGNTINMADNITAGIFEGIEFKGTGEWTLLSDLKSKQISFNGGTLNMNGFDLYVDAWSFNSGNPIVFNAGDSHFYCARFNNFSNELTFNQGTSTLHLISSNITSTKINGSFNFYDVIIESNAEINKSNSYNSLSVNSGITLKLEENSIQSILNLSLNGSAGSPVIIESNNPGVQSTFNVPLLGSVTADYVIFKDNNAVGSATFNATNSSQISNVTGWSGLKQGQTINFLPLNDITLNETIDLSATASSGLTVTYSVTPLIGSGSVAVDVLTPATSGLVAVVASQTGNGTYGPAQDVVQYVHLNEGVFANELGQMKEASIAVGAANGVSEGYNNTSNKSVSGALQAIVSPEGRLIVAGESRVMIWNEIPSTYDVPADVVVGQLDFTSLNQNPSQSILAPETNDFFTGAAVIGPNGELIVSDGRGVLIWNTIPTVNGTPADVIIGQNNFTATSMAVAQDKFLAPVGLAVSNDGKLIICDIAANRVLIYETIPQVNGEPADVVIGQLDFTSSTAGSSDRELNFPAFVAVSPNNELLISDVFNNRVLIYNTIPIANNEPASAVIGQDDFISNGSGVAANSFNIPMGVAVSKTGRLAISDAFNARILVYDQIPANNSTLPTLVLGQPDFNTNDPVNEDEISLRDISSPFGIAWDLSENLLITDTRLERILIYGEADLTAPAAFTTGLAVSVGGTITNAYFNASNTGIDVTVPIDNDVTLDGGTVQLQIKFGANPFENIGAVSTILSSALGTTLVKNISLTELQGATGYAEGAVATFRAIISDVVNNKTTGTESSTTITIDRSAPIGFTTGIVVSVGGTTVSGYWNSSNSSIDISSPIDNDASLIGGSIQIQAKIGAGSFTDIGNQVVIGSGDLGATLIASILSTELIALPDYTEGETILFRTILDDVASNQTISTESASATVIDTTLPPSFSVDNVAITGGTIITNTWNSTNTSIGVTVPVETEPSITGGTIQLQVRFGAAPFINIEAPYTVVLSDLGTNKTINISKAVFEAATGYQQGQTVEFNAIKTDIAGNQTTGTLSGTTLLINESATVVFTTGTALTVGGVINTGYFNASNTSIEIDVPIQNDPTLVGGTVQMQAKISSNSFEAIGNTPTIVLSDLGSTITIVLLKSEIESLAGFAQGDIINFRATIINNIGSQIVGAESSSTFIIDTILPTDFTATFVTTGVNSNDAVQGYWNANTTGIDFTIPLDGDGSLIDGTIQLQIDVDENGYTNIGNQYNIVIGDLSNTVNLTIDKTDFEAASGIGEGSDVDFKVIVTDIAGNSTEGTISNNKVIVDRVAPSINTGLATTLSSTYIVGSDVQPKINLIEDVSGIQQFVFNYNLVSSMLLDVYNQVVLTPDQDGSVITDIKTAIQGSSEQIGLKYYVEITDNAGNINSSIDNEEFINLKFPNGVTWNKFGVGTTTEKYKIMAVPLQLENSAVEHVFSDIYGGSFDNTKMRIWSYAGGTTSEYSEATANTNLTMGKGYFALAAISSDITTPAGTTSFQPVQNNDGDNEQGFIITLVDGWNMIGNPFLHDVSWSDIVALSGITDEVDNLQIYNGGWVTSSTTIKTGEGAFVFNNTGGSYLLKIPTRTNIGGRTGGYTPITNGLSEPSWEVLFKVIESNGKEYTIGGVGMNETANYDKDRFDLLNPPAFAKMKIMDFNHPEFSINSFKKDIRKTKDNELWAFEYKVESEEIKHTISWDNSYFGEDSPELYLIDKSHFTTVDMKKVNSYTFSHNNVTKFEIYFGYDVLEQALPEELITQSPFPNPFTQDITFNLGLPKGEAYTIEVRIFDSIGKEIKRLAPRAFEPGYTSITWNGIDRNGAYIPAGIYSYKIQIKSGIEEIISTGKIIKR